LQVEGIDTRYSWRDADVPIQEDERGHERMMVALGVCYHLLPEVVVRVEEAM